MVFVHHSAIHCVTQPPQYYSLPSIPAFALLIGKLWDEGLKDENKSLRLYMTIALAFIAVILLIGAGAAWVILAHRRKSYSKFLGTWWPYSGWSGVSAQVAVLQRMRIPTVVVLAGSSICVLIASVALLKIPPAAGFRHNDWNNSPDLHYGQLGLQLDCAVSVQLSHCQNLEKSRPCPGGRYPANLMNTSGSAAWFITPTERFIS